MRAKIKAAYKKYSMPKLSSITSYSIPLLRKYFAGKVPNHIWNDENGISQPSFTVMSNQIMRSVEEHESQLNKI